MTLLGLVRDLLHDSVTNVADVPLPGDVIYLIDEDGNLVLDVDGNPIPVT